MITYLIIVINHQKRRNIRDLTESREKRGFASPPHLFASSPTNRSNYQLQFFPLLYKCLAPSNAAPVRRHENGHQERKEEKKTIITRVIKLHTWRLSEQRISCAAIESFPVDGSWHTRSTGCKCSISSVYNAAESTQENAEKDADEAHQVTKGSQFKWAAW